MSLLKKKKFNIPRRRLANDNIRVSNPSNIFQRNRTLIGSTSNRLDNLNIKSGLESPRSHIHHLTTKRRKFFGILIVVITAIVFLWVLINNFTATVIVSTSSNVTMSKSVDISRYEKAIQDYLDNNPINRFKFLVNNAELTSYISSILPEVESVTQKNMIKIGETNFVVMMRTPVAGWAINNKQYYVDAMGVPFEQNYFSSPTVQIVDNSGVSLQTGQVSVSKRFLGFVGLIVSLAKINGYMVTQAILPANTTRELEIKLSGINLSVKLSIDRPAGEQIEDMSRAIQYFTSRNQTPSYIDVRVSGKAFFK